MLNHTYTSVNNANLVDCGKKQHIPSQPSPLLKDNFLGEFRTELDKKKVLANLGIATELSLVWENIKGDIGSNKALMEALDKRTKYTSDLNPDIETIADGIAYIESILGKDLEAEAEQNKRLTSLESTTTNLRSDLESYKDTLSQDLTKLNNYITNNVDVPIAELSSQIQTIVTDLKNITDLITVSDSDTNALKLKVGDNAGLYVENLSPRIDELDETVGKLGKDVSDINASLGTFVTKDDLGGGDGDYNFVNQSEFEQYTQATASTISTIQSELNSTVKTGEDGHVNTLFVNQISKTNEGNIKVADSFEVTSGIPLDVRCVVPTLKDLENLDPNVCYPGMAVIVSAVSALYILKEPVNQPIDEAYIKNSDNWKCPEDLVTEIITATKYAERVSDGSLSTSIFYYVIEEEEDHWKEEPQPGDYDSDEAYRLDWLKWSENLKVLGKQYMSATWGNEISAMVASKATVDSVNKVSNALTELNEQVKTIVGSGGNVSLSELRTQVQQNSDNLSTLTKNDGPIKTLEANVSTLSSDLQNNYATKDELATESENSYTRIHNEFENYTASHANAIAASINTQNATIGSAAVGTLTLGDIPVAINDGRITINGNDTALSTEVPIIVDTTLDDYNNSSKEENTYYYVYDDTDRYILDSEFKTYKQTQSDLNTRFGQDIAKLLQRVDELEAEIKALKSQLEGV